MTSLCLQGERVFVVAVADGAKKSLIGGRVMASATVGADGALVAVYFCVAYGGHDKGDGHKKQEL